MNRSQLITILNRASKYIIPKKSGGGNVYGSNTASQSKTTSGIRNSTLQSLPASSRNQRSNKAIQSGSSVMSKKVKEKRIAYFAVKVPAARINAVLDVMFHYASADDSEMYRALKRNKRVQPAFHVTLIHRAAVDPDYWAHLSNMRVGSSPELGYCKVYLNHLVWDDKVMAFTVSLGPSDGSDEQWRSVNDIAHITVGTATDQIKPVISNDLLATWRNNRSGETGIKEMVVNVEQQELDGVVEAVSF